MRDSRDNFDWNDRPPATPEWFVTFADLMSLLLALFVMLASFSEVQEPERFRAMSHSLHSHFGRATEQPTPAETLRPRDLQLAAPINAARSRRESLLRVE